MVREYHNANWFVLFGSGEDVHINDFKEYINAKGIPMVKFWMTPNEVIEDKYNLKRGEEINDMGLVEFDYPRINVHFLDVSPLRMRVFIETDFLGGKTRVSMKNIAQKSQINDLQQQVRILNASNHRWAKKYDELTNRVEVFLRKNRELYSLAKEPQVKKEEKDDTS